MKNVEELSNQELKNINGGNFFVSYFQRVIEEMRDMMREAGVIS